MFQIHKYGFFIFHMANRSLLFLPSRQIMFCAFCSLPCEAGGKNTCKVRREVKPRKEFLGPEGHPGLLHVVTNHFARHLNQACGRSPKGPQIVFSWLKSKTTFFLQYLGEHMLKYFTSSLSRGTWHLKAVLFF